MIDRGWLTLADVGKGLKNLIEADRSLYNFTDVDII